MILTKKNSSDHVRSPTFKINGQPTFFDDPKLERKMYKWLPKVCQNYQKIFTIKASQR